MKLMEIVTGEFQQLTDHIFLHTSDTGEKKKWEYNETVHQLFTDFRKAYDSVRREALCIFS
jgi:hypothetical protein